MLKQRIITALILLPIALCGFFLLEGSGFALFIGLVVTLGSMVTGAIVGAMNIGLSTPGAGIFSLFLLHDNVAGGMWSSIWCGIAGRCLACKPAGVRNLF